MKNVYIVIVNYKVQKDTLELLNSLKEVKKNDFKLNALVVDNYPNDPIKIDEEKFGDINLSIIYSEKNLGFTGGSNLGISFALRNGADYVLILNNDTIVDEHFLVELLKVAKEKGDGIFLPKIYFEKGYEFHKDRYREEDLGKVIWYAGGIIDWKNVYASHRGVDEVDTGQFDDLITTDFATGCCFLVTKNVLENVGTFDDKYFLYNEDVDFSLRAKKAGFKIYFVPKSIVWHKNAGSTGGSGSSLQDYFTTRNRLLFGFRYASFRSKVALIRESLRLIFSGRSWQKAGAIDFYLGRFGKGRMDI